MCGIGAGRAVGFGERELTMRDIRKGRSTDVAMVALNGVFAGLWARRVRALLIAQGVWGRRPMRCRRCSVTALSRWPW